MVRLFRFVLIAMGIALLVFGAGLYWQQPWALDIWLWPDSSRLSNIFIASIAAAIAAPIIWIGISGQIGASVGGALNLLVTFAGSAILLSRQVGQTDNSRVLTYSILFAVSAIVVLGVFFYSRRFPIEDPLPTPLLVRWSFALFAVVLILAGTGLLLAFPHIFPWPLPPNVSALYGWVFLGAAVYFLYGFARPSWQNAKGQLMGFLAYDLVLIYPYLAHLQTVLPEHRLSLIIYLSVIVYSGLPAIFFLSLYRPGRTRLNPYTLIRR